VLATNCVEYSRTPHSCDFCVGRTYPSLAHLLVHLISRGHLSSGHEAALAFAIHVKGECYRDPTVMTVADLAFRFDSVDYTVSSQIACLADAINLRTRTRVRKLDDESDKAGRAMMLMPLIRLLRSARQHSCRRWHSCRGFLGLRHGQ